MNWYKKASTQLTAWHISNFKFKMFDPYETAQGIMWFAKDKNHLVSDHHGANINNRLPIYLYKCTITSNKMAGWDEYDKYSLGELKSMGYDTIGLDDDIVVFDPKNIRIESVEQIK